MYMELYIKRKESRMSQKAVADVLGINKDTYRMKENGEYDFSIKEAKKLAKLFNSTLDELFKDFEKGA